MKKRTVTLQVKIDSKDAIEFTTSQRIVSNALRKFASKKGQWSIIEYTFVAVDGKLSSGTIYNK